MRLQTEMHGSHAPAGLDDAVEAGLISLGMESLATGMVIGASFVTSVGMNLQKISYDDKPASSINPPTPLARSGSKHRLLQPRYRSAWLAGIACMVTGGLMDFVALPFLPLSRVAALGSCTMVANVVVSPMFFSESLQAYDVVGCLLAVVGTATACVFGAGRERALGSSELFSRLTAPMFLHYAAAAAVVLVCLRWAIEGFHHVARAARRQRIISGPLQTVWVSENRDAIELLPKSKVFPFISALGPQFYPCVHAIYAGAVGAHAVTFAKICLAFATNTVSHGCCDWVSALSAALFSIPLAFCLYKQLRYLNIALEMYPHALFVAPNYQSAWMITGVIVGMMLYQEGEQMTTSDTAFFLFGVLITLVGLAVLSMRAHSTLDEVEETLSRCGSVPQIPVTAAFQGMVETGQCSPDSFIERYPMSEELVPLLSSPTVLSPAARTV